MYNQDLRTKYERKLDELDNRKFIRTGWKVFRTAIFVNPFHAVALALLLIGLQIELTLRRCDD
jgi:hypothetical protein